jgi:hypothetical protein
MMLFGIADAASRGLTDSSKLRIARYKTPYLIIAHSLLV